MFGWFWDTEEKEGTKERKGNLVDLYGERRREGKEFRCSGCGKRAIFLLLHFFWSYINVRINE